jgi:type VI secretion system secreted protein VgrG
LLAKSLSAGSASLVDGFEWRPQEDFSLGFIGLFDTVAGIISPLQGDFSAGNANNPGLDLHIVPGTVGKVVQLVARDEFRHNFPLTRTDDDIVLPGAHSDIGGGYLLHDREKLLLSRPDSNLVSVSEANERTLAYSRTRSEFDRHLSQWQAKGLSPELVTWAVNQPYHRKRDLIAEKRVYVSIRGEREVFGHLSLIYLRIMRELAVRHQVPFDAIDARDPRFELAPELHSIAAKLHGHALGEASNTQLSEAEEALLQRHYIHQSAHWNAVNDWNNSDLDAMFINRPAEGGQRRVFANR